MVKSGDLLIGGVILALGLFGIQKFSGKTEEFLSAGVEKTELRTDASVEKVDLRTDASVEKKLISASQTETRWESAKDIISTIFKKDSSSGGHSTTRLTMTPIIVKQTITPTDKNLTGISSDSPFLDSSPNISLVSGGTAYASVPKLLI